jgi:hypothetical protein
MFFEYIDKSRDVKMFLLGVFTGEVKGDKRELLKKTGKELKAPLKCMKEAES